MSLSKRDIEILNDALNTNSLDIIKAYLKTYNFKTFITKSYAFIKALDNPLWMKELKPSQDDLDKYRKLGIDSHKKNKVVNLNITPGMINRIIKEKDNSFLSKLVYLLLITGRRQDEILNKPYFLSEGKLNIELSKRKNTIIFQIKKLLNNNLAETDKLLKYIRSNNEYKTMEGLNTSLNRYIKNLGFKKTHELRGLYALLIHKFYLPDKPLSMVIKDYLGHSGDQVGFYDYIEIKDIKNNPFTAQDYKKKNNTELKKMLKELGYRGGVSKLKKSVLLSEIEKLI